MITMNEHFFQRMLWGLIIVAVGVGFLLNQTGYLSFSIGDLFSTFWPVILIVIGLQNFVLGRMYRSGSASWGVIMMAIGFVFLGRNLDWFDWSLGEIIQYGWPVILIIVGINMMFRPGKKKRPQEGDSDWKAFNHAPHAPHGPHMPEPPLDKPVPPAPPLHPDPLLEDFEKRMNDQAPPPPPQPDSHGPYGQSQGDWKREFKDGMQGFKREMKDAHKHKHKHKHGHERVEWWNHDPGVQTRSGFIGDIHLGSDYWELKPMNISHFIGDTVLDLTKAQIPLGETRITISSFIGDVKVFIPNDYEVGVHVVSSAFLGDASVLEQKEGGLFKNMNVESPYYHETDKKIRLVVSTFIGDVRVTKVG
jgi:lia operon protein LiaF